MTEVLRLAAFTDDPSGGNPAGVVLAATLPDDAEMQRIAAEVGYSETAFLAPLGERAHRVRYFSPAAEVPFCGHATIAAGVALGRRDGAGHFEFETNVGVVPVEVTADAAGRVTAALTSVAPAQRDVSPDVLADFLAHFGWTGDDLDPTIPPIDAYAGAWHLVLPLRSRDTLARMRYPFDPVRDLMLERDLTTIQIIWREDATTFHVRDPFPVGGVVEDPATGAAAAALGGYLRDAGLVAAPTDLVLHQGDDLGRPSRLEVHVPIDGGIRVSGTAVFEPV
jgi:PhzF family phenazine biosynthesis protein